jgi:hypothetical protein
MSSKRCRSSRRSSSRIDGRSSTRQRRIWYLGFFAIDAKHRSAGLFEDVIAQMWEPVMREGGIATLDMCAQNVELGLGKAIERTLHGLTPEMTAECVDTQSYWAYCLGDME